MARVALQPFAAAHSAEAGLAGHWGRGAARRMSSPRVQSRRQWLLASCSALGCRGARETVLHAADGARLGAQEVDARPLWLLPPAAVGWFSAEVATVRNTPLGARALAELSRALRLPQTSEFDFARDVDALWAATYATQGYDVLLVLRGRFDAAALRRLAERTPAVLEQYAERSLLRVGTLALSALTPATALAGSLSAVRRSLERISERRVQDDLPQWVSALVAAPGAHFAAAVDAVDSDVMAAAAGRLPGFAKSVSRVSLVGNFKPPGLNIAATLSTRDRQQPPVLAAALQQAVRAADTYGRVLGLGPTVARFDSQVHDHDLQVLCGLNEHALLILLQRAAAAAGQNPARGAPSSRGLGSGASGRALGFVGQP